jgi:UDP-N-acetylmuramoyl-L-alanyl-D-glutamate--2,6-diaminopimelate ligase
VGQVAVDYHLPGQFNISNALAAISVGISQKVDLFTTKQALEKVRSMPGRMEKVDLGQSFIVIIDYAHTPDALEKVYQTLKSSAKAKMIAVLGACGDRDKTKRPILGALAGRFADYAIVTNEDPYTEDAQSIIDQVAEGVPRGAQKKKSKIIGKNFWKILDRREAIRKAFSLAHKDDIVIITGKGAEECIVVGHEKKPWSDKKVSKELIREILNK